MAKFYQVGGSVRDKFLGLPSKDIDYAVEAGSFEEMHQSILDRGGEVFLSTPQYFTIRARVPELGACDFVLCRKESAYSDGRRPDVVIVGSIFDDLARRDFTINAMALTEEGELLDPWGGMNDLQETKVIRCVGNAKSRFDEDGLRLIRAIRFSVTKGLKLDESIIQLLFDEPCVVWTLRGVSIERIREELFKAFHHDTWKTLGLLGAFGHLSRYLFDSSYGLGKQIWLKPTLEAR